MAESNLPIVHCGRVRFSAEQLDHHESEIVIDEDEVGKAIEVHLGFLKINHDYHIKFRIKDHLGEDITSDPLQNVNVQLLEATPSEDGLGHELLLNFKAQKEKLMKEELVLMSSKDPESRVRLILHARVLGKDKGTPSLRLGIHCVHSSVDEDSHLSDWQGFD